ncbi:hypothetical protein LEP1GSC150_3284 [Leptospira interrogans serovar Copenhageni str. LT2050]|uniref:Uncharacterized protein n=1 Tax=Leptospira interrogans serovar Copenhageni str. LT2050 TaxID=1001598 RepID=M3G7H5_LEPIT|nr:hypothetical protein LEP1GSC150_3284 [Leptospira interrogans serovar Copenhageni str. LT2050]
MVNVVVASVTFGAGGDRPVETITFAFDSIRYSVTASTSVGKLETKTFTGKGPKIRNDTRVVPKPSNCGDYYENLTTLELLESLQITKCDLICRNYCI